MSSAGTAYLFDVVRSPRGKARADGGLAQLKPQELVRQLCASLDDASRRRGLRTRRGTAARLCRPGRRSGRQHRAGVETSQRLARHAAAYTLNNYCVSSLTAIGQAAAMVSSGQARSVLAGGVEMMSRVAVHGRRRRLLHRRDDACAQPLHSCGARRRSPGRGRGHRSSSTRRAAHSIRNSAPRRPRRTQPSRARAIPMTRPDGSAPRGRRMRAPADHCRESRGDAAGLRRACERLCSCARHAASIIAIRIAHAPPICDGASLALVGGSDWLASAARSHRQLRRVRRRSVCIAARGFRRDGSRARASRHAARDVDCIEFMEAFAVTIAKFLRDRDVDPERVNVAGGHLAKGHPMGASGGILLIDAARCARSARRNDGPRGRERRRRRRRGNVDRALLGSRCNECRCCCFVSSSVAVPDAPAGVCGADVSRLGTRARHRCLRSRHRRRISHAELPHEPRSSISG